MKHLIVLCLFLISVSCITDTNSKLKAGIYKVELLINDSEILPFMIEVTSETKLKVFNADEIIEIDEIEYKNDSVYIKMPVFEGYLVAKIENIGLNGYYIKPNLNRVVPFVAKQSKSRFEITDDAKENITGSWETVFSPDSEEDKYIAKGVFNQNGNIVTGTFQTTTGDYRYLEGVVNGNKMKLSTFDGAHAFLFTATVTDSIMEGIFYSGNHWEEPFIAKRNKNYNLPSTNELTFLNEGYEKISFSFPDSEGNIVSLNDERFNNKVVLVQIMGTWCPNCLDESKYYANFYKKNKDKGLEIIALAFEYVKTEEKAFNNIKRLTDRIGIEYSVLLAQKGTTSKTKAQEKIPMLNHILSYPTTIFIDKKGGVRKIHTGFNGPATGKKFTIFKTEFENFVSMLLRE